MARDRLSGQPGLANDAGQLPPGAMIKFYFGTGRAQFGLPPTRAALAAYLDMLGDAPLPWLVSAQGGDVIATGLSRIALERGGHLQVGLEPSGDARRRNVELVQAAVALAAEMGRLVATPTQARVLLRLPGAA